MMINLITLTENDKRLIILIFLIFILIFVIAGYLGLLIKKIMKFQAKKADTLVHDVVKAGVISERKKLFIFGMKKNNALLLKEAWIPFLIMLVASLTIILYCAISGNWDVNIFDYQKEGIGTLFFLPDFANASYTTVFGIRVLADWPPLLNSPHFEVEALGSYIFFFGMLIGGIWFLINVQAYMARTHRLYKIVHNVFEKSLDNFGGMAEKKPYEEVPLANEASNNQSDNENKK